MTVVEQSCLPSLHVYSCTHHDYIDGDHVDIQAILENAALDQFSIVGSSAPIGNCLTGRIDLGFRTDEHNHIAKVVRHHAP